MLETLFQLAIFISKTFVIIAAVLIVFGGIIALATKGKEKSESKLVVKKLNKRYDNMKDELRQAVMSKKEYKKATKAKKKKAEKKHKLYVLDFEGDIKASDVGNLQNTVTALLTLATPEDEVVLRLESAGGVMHGYGLAASQLARFREKNIPLTVCVDKIAASGGYMMACVANKIIAAPFAIIGSIGVIAQLPNFHRLLKDNHVDWEQITAGQYKRTLTMLGENTREGRHKFQEEINEAHDLFKEFISSMRPQTDLDKVATGEHWFARKAFELNLVDTLSTSDDYLLKACNECDLFHVKYKKKPSLMEKLSKGAHTIIEKGFISLLTAERRNTYL